MATVGKDEGRAVTTELLPSTPKAVVQADYTLKEFQDTNYILMDKNQPNLYRCYTRQCSKNHWSWLNPRRFNGRYQQRANNNKL